MSAVDEEFVRKLVATEIAEYKYEPPPPGTTIGVPWSAEKELAYLEKLKAAIIDPYLQRFVVKESLEQTGYPNPKFADFWVVAKGKHYLEWYDPVANEFGLAQHRAESDVPVLIGVRGDLFGVFCAI